MPFPRKYEVWHADLNPRKGHAQSGVRPVVIVSGDAFNEHASTVMVVPLTSNVKAPFPSEFLITPSSQNGLAVASRFLGSQVMTLDKRYLSRKMGVLDVPGRQRAHDALAVAFDREDLFSKWGPAIA